MGVSFIDSCGAQYNFFPWSRPTSRASIFCISAMALEEKRVKRWRGERAKFFKIQESRGKSDVIVWNVVMACCANALGRTDE